MPTENVTTKFKVDISDLKKNISTANNQIKLLTAEMKNANAGMAKGAETADSLTTKIQKQGQIVQQEEKKLQALKDQLARLNQNQKQGEQIIADLTAKHQKAVEVYGEASDEAKAYAAELGRAQAAQDRNRDAIERLNVQIVNQDTAVKNAAAQVDKYETALAELSKGTDNTADSSDDLNKSLKKVDDSSNDVADGGINAMGVALGNLASRAITFVINKLGELAGAVKDAFLEFDEGRDAVVKATGATGKAADELTKSFANVSRTVVGDFDTIGSALGEVNTRFGYTGKELEDATTQFVKFADITGTDATKAVQLVSRAMGDAGIKSEDYSEILDQLTVAAQASGISVDKLTEYLAKYGAPMRALGFDTKESIAIFSQWEKAGVNTEIAFSGMKKAIGNWSAEGKDAREEFRKTLEQIAAAPDIASATTQAIEVFGQKAGPDLADAIQAGRFEYSELLNIIEGSEGAVTNTFDETQSGADKAKLAIQNMRTTAAELANNFMQKYGPQIESAIGKITGLLEKWAPKIEDAITWITDHLPEIEAGVVAIGAAFGAWKVVAIVTAVTTALKDLTIVEAAAIVKAKLLNVVMAANPIGLVVAAIAALVTGLVVLWKKSDKFRNFWKGLWENIKGVVKPVIDFIKGYFETVWETIQALFNGVVKFVTNTWNNVKPIFSTVANWINTNIFQPIIAFFQPVIDFYKTAWEIIKQLAAGAWEAIKIIWGVVSDWFNTNIITPISNFFSSLWTGISTAATTTWNTIKTVWTAVSTWFKDTIITPVSTAFSNLWTKVKTGASNAWTGIKNVFAHVADWFKEKFADAWQKVKDVFSTGGAIFEGIVDGIVAAFKTVVNAIIRGINNVIAIPFNAINDALDTIRNVEIAGIKPFDGLISRFDVPQIPELARGGIINRPTNAIIGEDGREAIIPLEKNKAGLRQIASLLADEINNGAVAKGQVTAGNTYNFTQTNNSPKALSRWEIYRQTKNLISTINTVNAGKT